MPGIELGIANALLVDLAAWAWLPFLDLDLYHRLLYPLAKLILAMAVGLLLGNLIEGAGLSRRFGRFVLPWLRWGHLQESSAAAFTTALASSVAANTMLMNSYQDKAISRQELILSALVLTLPTYLLHLPTTFFIITPFVGRIGVVYLVILLAAALLRTLVFLAYGRLSLPETVACPECPRFAQPDWQRVWRESWPKFKKRLGRILLVTIPVFLAILLAQEAGGFRWLNQRLAEYLRGTAIPTESLSIIGLSLAAETSAGFAAAGAFWQTGALTAREILLTLLIGTVVSTPMRAVRHQLPYYMGIFSPALGLELMVLSQGARVLSLLPFMVWLYWWWPGLWG
jgi:hypothetical protein